MPFRRKKRTDYQRQLERYNRKCKKLSAKGKLEKALKLALEYADRETAAEIVRRAKPNPQLYARLQELFWRKFSARVG